VTVAQRWPTRRERRRAAVGPALRRRSRRSPRPDPPLPGRRADRAVRAPARRRPRAAVRHPDAILQLVRRAAAAARSALPASA